MQKKTKERKSTGPRARRSAKAPAAPPVPGEYGGFPADEPPADEEWGPIPGVIDAGATMGVTLNVPAELLARIDYESAREGVSAEEFIVGAVRGRLDGGDAEDGGGLPGCDTAELVRELRRRGAKGEIVIPVKL